MDNWVIKQKWSDLVFLSYEVDKIFTIFTAKELEPDLYENKAYLSIVPLMSDIGSNLLQTFHFLN